MASSPAFDCATDIYVSDRLTPVLQCPAGPHSDEHLPLRGLTDMIHKMSACLLLEVYSRLKHRSALAVPECEFSRAHELSWHASFLKELTRAAY